LLIDLYFKHFSHFNLEYCIATLNTYTGAHTHTHLTECAVLLCFVYTSLMMTVLRSKRVQGASVTNDYLLMTVQFVGAHTVTSVIMIAAVQYEVWFGYFVSSFSKFFQRFN